jgi:hypothetical protein
MIIMFESMINELLSRVIMESPLLLVLEFELWASQLLGRHTTARATLPAVEGS